METNAPNTPTTQAAIPEATPVTVVPVKLPTTEEFIAAGKATLRKQVTLDKVNEFRTKADALVIKDADDVETYNKVDRLRKDIKQVRTGIEKTRTELKSVATAYGKAVDAEAKALTALVEPIEDELAAKQAAIDKIIAERKAAEEKRKQEEAQRKRELEERNQKRRNWLFSNGFLYNGTQFTATINGRNHLITDEQVESFDTDQWKGGFFDAVLADRQAEADAKAAADAAAQAAAAAQVQQEPATVVEAPQPEPEPQPAPQIDAVSQVAGMMADAVTQQFTQPDPAPAPQPEVHFEVSSGGSYWDAPAPQPEPQPANPNLEIINRVRGLDPVLAYKAGREDLKKQVLEILGDHHPYRAAIQSL